MARRAKVAKPFHVISTGFGADDFKGLNAGDAYLSGDLTEDNITGFDTKEQAMQHPAAVAFREREQKIEDAAMVEHLKSQLAYAAKYAEAIRYESLAVKPPDSELQERLWPYITTCMGIEGVTAQDAADSIIDAHNATTVLDEAERTQLKVDTQ